MEDFSNVNVLEKRTFKSKNWLVVRTNVCRKYTGIKDVRPGEEVVLFGENPPVDEIARKIGTINYEVVCAVGKRVPRIYVQ